MKTDQGSGTAARAVEHLLQIDVEGMQHSHGPIVLLESQSLLPSLELGQRFDPDAWPPDRFGPPLADGEALFVVRSETRVREVGQALLCHRTLTLAASADPQCVEVVEARAETESQRRLAEFAESLARNMAADLAQGLVDRCAADIEGELRSTPSRGLAAADQTAWHEAAKVLQADQHLLRSETESEVESLVYAAVRSLTLAQRQALWLHRENSAESNDLKYLTDEWADRDLLRFDPATAWPGALEAVEAAITRRVLFSLANEPLEHYP